MDTEKRKILILQVVNTMAFLVMVILNALANILPINNQTTGGVSDKYPDLFAPAGITFSIWGLIYLLLGLFILYQLGLFTRKDNSHEKAILQTGWLFALSSFANALWIILWHHDMILLSLVMMVAILLCLIGITSKIYKSEPDRMQAWFYKPAFSVYLGWITVASIANVTALLVSAGWNGFGIPEWVWTIAMMAIATVLTFLYIFLKSDIIFSLVVVWAFMGIVLKHVTVFNSEYIQVIIGGSLFMGLIGAAILCRLMPFKCKPRNEELD
ncbi:MAG: tryptophan-rich sensory protein [Clostridia bacterium]